MRAPLQTVETVVANTVGYGEVTVGKGLDSTGAMLLWVRRIGKEWNHDLYRTADGVTFTLVATPKLAVQPMQITDVFAVPEVGLCPADSIITLRIRNAPRF